MNDENNKEANIPSSVENQEIKSVTQILLSPPPNRGSIPFANPSIIFHPINANIQQSSTPSTTITNTSRYHYLPYFLPYKLTASTNELPPDFSWLSESCSGKAAIGIFGGGIMGLLMGVFLGAMSDLTPPVTMIDGKDVPQAPLKEQFRTTMRATADKSRYWCRQFAFITGVFGGSECLVEKYRGKHDIWNPVASGCITGAAMQAKSGPQAAMMGCGGFAAFSIVIDLVMGH